MTKEEMDQDARMRRVLHTTYTATQQIYNGQQVPKEDLERALRGYELLVGYFVNRRSMFPSTFDVLQRELDLLRQKFESVSQECTP